MVQVGDLQSEFETERGLLLDAVREHERAIAWYKQVLLARFESAKLAIN